MAKAKHGFWFFFKLALGVVAAIAVVSALFMLWLFLNIS